MLNAQLCKHCLVAGLFALSAIAVSQATNLQASVLQPEVPQDGVSQPSVQQPSVQQPSAQQPSVEKPSVQKTGISKPRVKPVSASASASSRTTAKLTDEQKQGYALLETSEASSRGLEAPMRTYGLMQIATAYPTTGNETKKTRDLLKDAFTSSLEIHDDNDTKQELQTEIFRTLLPLSQDDVEELVSQADPKVRKVTSEQMIRMFTSKKQFEKAIDLVNQVTSWDEFPYASASSLIDELPPDMTAEKQGLLVQAVNSYKNHTHKGMRFGEGTLSGMIVKNYAAMNPKLVLQAIDEILSQAKASDENNHNNNISIGGTGGTVSFTSQYEYELFSLMPVLQRLDESRANSLLQENQALQAKLQQFPQGTQSVSPPAPPRPSDAPAKDKATTETSQTKKPQRVQTAVFSGDAATAGMMRAIQDAGIRTQQIVEEAETDPAQALAHATTLPVVLDGMMMTSPRGNALTSIAKAAAKDNPAIAKQALADLRKIVPDMPLTVQSGALQSAITTYIAMGDNDAAASAISEGIKVAEKLLENDLNPDDPNQALKAWWPSANAYRSFVEAQTKISRQQTLALLKEIKDQDIRTIETITYARAMLGLPNKQNRIQEKRKSMNRTMVTDRD